MYRYITVKTIENLYTKYGKIIPHSLHAFSLAEFQMAAYCTCYVVHCEV